VKQYILVNGAVAPSESMIARLHETSEGNPFFLEELIAVLRVSGELGSYDDGLSSISLPDGVREAIRCRINPLAGEVQKILELAAVVGRNFTLQIKEAATGLPPETLLRQLSHALAAGLIDDVEAFGRFRFAHALVRETLYLGLHPDARLAAHRRIALGMELLLERGVEVPLSALAHHFSLAASLGEANKAATYCERAGQVAMKQLAYDEAATQFERALAALDLAGDDPSRRIGLLLAFGAAAQQAGNTLRAADSFARAARLARDQGDAARLAISAMRH